MPTWKLVGYSAAISALPFLGHALGDISNARYLRQVVETVPVLVCLPFVLRLPKRPRQQMTRAARVALLLAPFLLLSLTGEVPTNTLQQSIVVLAVVDAVAIGVSEELTFRFSLHRLWSHYSAAFYVMASSVIFGLAHVADGLSAILVAAVIGLFFRRGLGKVPSHISKVMVLNLKIKRVSVGHLMRKNCKKLIQVVQGREYVTRLPLMNINNGYLK